MHVIEFCFLILFDISCILQRLMIGESSPVKDSYPFETDLNGKMQEWEAVVLIPFIDEVSHHSINPFLLILNEGQGQPIC